MDTQRYKKFIENMEIMAINLKELKVTDVNLKVDRDALTVTVGYDDKGYQKNGEELEVFPCFLIEVESDSNKESAFKIEIQYSVLYHIENLMQFGEEYIDIFLNTNVPVNIWPYGREFISSLTTKMGFQPLLIKPMVVNAKIEPIGDDNALPL